MGELFGPVIGISFQEHTWLERDSDGLVIRSSCAASPGIIIRRCHILTTASVPVSPQQIVRVLAHFFLPHSSCFTLSLGFRIKYLDIMNYPQNDATPTVSVPQDTLTEILLQLRRIEHKQRDIEQNQHDTIRRLSSLTSEVRQLKGEVDDLKEEVDDLKDEVETTGMNAASGLAFKTGIVGIFAAAFDELKGEIDSS